MDLQGKIIAALEPRSGVSARGEWKSQDFVIETMDSFPRKMVFSVFGADRLQRFAIQVGQMVNVSFDIDAHEYNGRWFNSVNAWAVNRNNAAQTSTAQSPQAAPSAMPFPSASEQSAGYSTDDLPF